MGMWSAFDPGDPGSIDAANPTGLGLPDAWDPGEGCPGQLGSVCAGWGWVKSQPDGGLVVPERPPWWASVTV